MNQFVALLLVFCASLSYAQPLPRPVAGTIRRIDHFASRYVEPRHIDIWLPAGYNASKKYAVVYMHDGQMLFDSATTWNHQSWDVDDIATGLMATHQVQDFIVVGVWNAGKSRHADYFPQKPYVSLTADQQAGVNRQLQAAGRTTETFQPNSDAYLKFLVTELKPRIDSTYAVYTDRAHTFVAGSSMGGLISLYALCEYPAVFGGAACLSTHWPGIFSVDDNPVPAAFFAYLRTQLPSPKTHKIYFDYGDQTLDALYPPLQRQADEVVKATGYTATNWTTRFFPGENHSEQAWRKRLAIPLTFLLTK